MGSHPPPPPDQLARGAHIRADIIDRLLHEHNQPNGPRPHQRLAPESDVVIDEAGMVDNVRLWRVHQLARANQWRTVLVGDQQQRGAIDAGSMLAELVTGRVSDRWTAAHV